MAERVSSSGNSSANRLTGSSGGSGEGPNIPIDTPGTNQAASDFASYMSEGSSTQEPSRSSHDNPSTEQSQDRPQDKVEQKEKDNSESKSDSDGDSGGGDESGSSKGKEKTQTQTSTTAEEFFSPGDAILQSLLGGEQQTQRAEAAGQSQMPAGSADLEGIVQQVAEKMLVSDPAGGGREVRIMLKDNVLPGTEIRILQEGGKLQIQFVTDHPKSQELLQQHQNALQDRLADKLSKQDIEVSVEMESHGHGDQQDGRSRQQRKIEDEVEEA